MRPLGASTEDQSGSAGGFALPENLEGCFDELWPYALTERILGVFEWQQVSIF